MTMQRKSHSARLDVLLSGDRADKGSISALVLSRTIGGLQRAIQREAVRLQLGPDGLARRGRPPRFVVDACQLKLVAVERGSVRLRFDIGAEADASLDKRAIPFLGIRAANAFVDDLVLMSRMPEERESWCFDDIPFRRAIFDFTSGLDVECTGIKVSVVVAGAAPRTAELDRTVRLNALPDVAHDVSAADRRSERLKVEGGRRPAARQIDIAIGRHPSTVQQFVQSGMLGSWRSRTDIGDSVEYARALRKQASTRHHD